MFAQEGAEHVRLPAFCIPSLVSSPGWLCVPQGLEYQGARGGQILFSDLVCVSESQTLEYSFSQGNTIQPFAPLGIRVSENCRGLIARPPSPASPKSYFAATQHIWEYRLCARMC